MTTAMDPSTRFVRSLPGNYFMLREAAEILEVSQNKLRDFIKSNPEGLGPSFATMFGKVKIYLYTKEDIAAIRQHLESQRKVYPNSHLKTSKIGRPIKWTEEQRKARQRLYSQSHYHRGRFTELMHKGKAHEARTHLLKAEAIDKELKNA